MSIGSLEKVENWTAAVLVLYHGVAMGSNLFQLCLCLWISFIYRGSSLFARKLKFSNIYSLGAFFALPASAVFSLHDPGFMTAVGELPSYQE